MKPNKTSISSRRFKVPAKAAIARKTYRPFLFASVFNGHFIHLRHRIDPRLFSVERQEPWPIKALTTRVTPKRLWRVRVINQRASARKPLPGPMTVTTDHTNHTNQV